MDHSTLPDFLLKTIDQIVTSGMREGRDAMRERVGEMPGNTAGERELAADLIGIAIVPQARAQLERAMAKEWRRDATRNMGMGSRAHDEIIVGSGYHAAVYAAVRARMGKPKPLVIEQSSMPGGVFTCSERASFWSNSRNRPGEPNAPGEDEGLNVIPGAVVQPSMLSSAEYQPNSDIGFSIRLALAMFAKVACDKRVMSVERSDQPPYRTLVEVRDDVQGRTWRLAADRVIQAPGIGTERSVNGDRILTFSQLMKRMDDPFPLRGMKRVAVIGSGDSAKCAIEALFGLGPAEHWSIPDLDRIERCDWYGNRLPATCELFRKSVRTRYKGIAALLPRDEQQQRNRLVLIRQAVVPIPNYDGVMVGDRRYDYAIFCTGYDTATQVTNLNMFDSGVPVARVVPQYRGRCYIVGPAAQIPYSDDESPRPWAVLPENRDAMWRLGPRTAQLAVTVD